MCVQLRILKGKKEGRFKFLSTNMDHHTDFAVIQAQNYNRSLTFQKPTWSVDSDRGYPNGNSSIGVDGENDFQTCMVSSAQPYSWWAVDLGQDVVITDLYMNGYWTRNGRHWRFCVLSH